MAIAPYAGLALQIKNEAEKRNDIILECCIGDLKEGLSEARSRTEDDYDVIISRGGTASLLRENGFPVIDISISIYDLLRSIRLANGARKRYAIVGFESITRNASFLQDVLPSDMNIKVVTINKADEADLAIRDLKEEGIEIVICDQISTIAASRYRLNYILINSGSESIAAAFNEAAIIGKEKSRSRDLIALCNRIIESCPDIYLLMKNNEVVGNGVKAESISKGFMNVMKRRVSDMRIGDSSALEYDDNGLLYSADVKKFSIDDNEFATLYIKKTKLPFSLESNGIVLHNAHWAEIQYENSFFYLTNANAAEVNTITDYSKRSYPVFLYGERGTGKGNLAQLLYTISQSSSYPLYDIDMEIAGKKATELIKAMYSENPEKKAVFHLKNMNLTSNEVIKRIVDLNEELKIAKRAYMIATVTLEKGEKLPPACMYYIERLQCLTLRTRTLREHREDIQSMANLYLAILNRQNGTDIISIEEEGLKELEAYDWPGNNDQLARVLKKLNVETRGQIIKAEDVRKVISEEKKMTVENTECQGLGIDIEGKTMKEIERMIALHVLEEENGRKANTAKRLGLSRATLWRMLQDE